MNRTAFLLALCMALTMCANAMGGIVFYYSDVSGLSAEAEFTLISATQLQVRYKNTSTGAPVGFDNSDQILSGVSWDFGAPGFGAPGETTITGGSVKTGPSSASLNFSITNVVANADVSGEFGYGNMDGTGALTNFVSSNTAAATAFGGANLDGTPNIDGPQGGLVANPAVIPLGGLGAIQDEVIATLTLGGAPLADLGFLFDNGVRFEYGSDAKFGMGVVPEPSTLALAACGLIGLIAWGWRRRKR
jgi:PEP-CTERM motif